MLPSKVFPAGSRQQIPAPCAWAVCILYSCRSTGLKQNQLYTSAELYPTFVTGSWMKVSHTAACQSLRMLWYEDTFHLLPFSAVLSHVHSFAFSTKGARGGTALPFDSSSWLRTCFSGETAVGYHHHNNYFSCAAPAEQKLSSITIWNNYAVVYSQCTWDSKMLTGQTEKWAGISVYLWLHLAEVETFSKTRILIILDRWLNLESQTQKSWPSEFTTTWPAVCVINRPGGSTKDFSSLRRMQATISD